MLYRKELDGLRALAVFSVILFHAGFHQFSGGFIGVDIFFVISGYLITKLLIERIQQNNFSLVEFFERRARRILPALFTVILVCLPFSLYLLLPHEFHEYSLSVAAVSMFISNFFFLNQSGYFANESSFQPLSHTWSLAVEEQFYIVFPFVLLFIIKFFKNKMFFVLLSTLVSSLLLSEYLITKNPTATYYLLPTRAWEILIGCVVAFLTNRDQLIHKRKIVNEFLGLVGLLLIGISIAFFDQSTQVPALPALIPTFGTALVITYTSQKTTIGRILGNKTLVYFGLISYSAYLWHQPVFVFVRQYTDSEPNDVTAMLLVGFTFALSAATYRFVEKPFRNRSIIKKLPFLIFMSLGVAASLMIGLLGEESQGFRNRLPSNIEWQSFGERIESEPSKCQPYALPSSDGLLACQFGSKRSNEIIFLYGDSHADALMQTLDRQFKRNGIMGIRIKLAECNVIPDVVRTSDNLYKMTDCLRKFRNLISLVEITRSEVVISSRWTFSLYPIASYIEDMPYANSEGGVEREEKREYGVMRNGKLVFDAIEKKRSLKSLIENFLDTGRNIHLIYPVPELAWDIARENWRYFNKQGSLLSDISIPVSDYMVRNSFVNSVFDSIQNRENFFRIKPYDVFCDTFITDRCTGQFETLPFYYDDDHLSDLGAKLLLEDFFSLTFSKDD